MSTAESLPTALSLAELQQLIGAQPADAQQYRALIQDYRTGQYLAFREGRPASELIAEYTEVIDLLLGAAWQHCIGDSDDLCLLAAGGYGRAELLPHSDIDLLILYRDGTLETYEQGLSGFVTFVWDMGLEVGQSVRSPAECASEARDDVTVVTNLMEARHLCGARDLETAMRTATAPDQVWPSPEFFAAKRDEQVQRYKRYDDTAYKLEPNVKEGPGGLRDIQIIDWVTQRHYGTGGLISLHDQGLLRRSELNDLMAGRSFLWQVRFALHMLSSRAEDRLLFDNQVKVAELFGYVDKSQNLAVEQFMQLYYRTIKGLSCLNDIFLQLIEEEIIHRDQPAKLSVLDEQFQLRHGFIELREPNQFQRRPLALLEIFRSWARHGHLEIKGISADTLREMRRDRDLIRRERESLAARECFIDMLRAPRGVLHSLRRMNRYGILGRYLPAFGKVIGRMQYDLFHTLTVDEHTLFVVRNLRRLAVPEFRHEFPDLSDLHDQLAKPELLYIAGLFHDIAKGRGGDHSELGADDAEEFGLAHGLSSSDRDLIAWLVRNHLLMSVTAQRKDVSDPDVVNDFARAVGSTEYLNYLYLLTVCDIRATNPKLWNGFREGLLRSLYVSAHKVLETGDPIASAELIAETRHHARLECMEYGLSDARIEQIWARLDDDYFLKHSADEVAWHTQAIANAEDLPCVLLRQFEHGTAVFIHMQDAPGLFVVTSGCLAQLGLTILDARIANSVDGHTLDTFIVAEADGKDIANAQRRQEISQALVDALKRKDAPQPVNRLVSRRRKHFSTPTQIYFKPDPDKQHTVMELVTNDRPGLLATVGAVFARHKVVLQTAKIGTIGERAEDVFFIVDAQGKTLDDPAVLHELRADLTQSLQQEQQDSP